MCKAAGSTLGRTAAAVAALLRCSSGACDYPTATATSSICNSLQRPAGAIRGGRCLVQYLMGNITRSQAPACKRDICQTISYALEQMLEKQTSGQACLAAVAAAALKAACQVHSCM